MNPETTSKTAATKTAASAHSPSCECRSCLDREIEMAARERRRDRWYFDLRARPQPVFVIA